MKLVGQVVVKDEGSMTVDVLSTMSETKVEVLEQCLKLKCSDDRNEKLHILGISER